MTDPVALGNTLKTNLTVRDESDALVDPATLTLTVRPPAGVPVVYSWPTDAIIVPLSLGLFYAEIPLTAIGLWEYDWSTTVPAQTKGGEVYVVAQPSSSAPYVPSVVDFVRLYLGGENWAVLFNSTNFGIDQMLLAVEIIKRRVLANPPSPSGESVLNQHVLAYLGILTALELIPACLDAWASKVISRSTGNDPAEITTYANRAANVERIRDGLLRLLPDIKGAALPYLDDVLVQRASVAAIDEDTDDRVTADPRDFPPDWAFPYRREEAIPPL